MGIPLPIFLLNYYSTLSVHFLILILTSNGHRLLPILATRLYHYFKRLVQTSKPKQKHHIQTKSKALDKISLHEQTDTNKNMLSRGGGKGDSSITSDTGIPYPHPEPSPTQRHRKKCSETGEAPGIGLQPRLGIWVAQVVMAPPRAPPSLTPTRPPSTASHRLRCVTTPLLLRAMSSGHV